MKPRRKPKRVGILTGGGDCPGLNAVIRAACRTAFNHGVEVYGVEDGFDGLLHRKLRQLQPADVSGILHLGGTILGTTNRANPFRYATRQGKHMVEVDRSGEVVKNFRELGLDALIAIGGDGTLSYAYELGKLGMKVIAIPKTMDNDVQGTEYSVGFSTAITRATAAIHRQRTTVASHERIGIFRVFGRDSGFTSLYTALNPA